MQHCLCFLSWRGAAVSAGFLFGSISSNSSIFSRGISWRGAVGAGFRFGSTTTTTSSIFSWGRRREGFQMRWRVMLKLYQHLPHSWKVGGFAGLWSLNDHNRWLPLLFFLSPPLLNAWYLTRYQLRDCFPIVLVCVGMEIVLVGQE